MSVHVSSEQNEASSRTRATDGEPHPLTDVAHLLDQAQSQLALAGRNNARICAELTTRIESLQRSAEEMERLLVQTERQAAQLANLYVATYQLHASLDPEEIHSAITDIAINLLGAQRFRVLLRSESGRMIVALAGDPQKKGNTGTVEYAGGDELVDACLGDRVLRFGSTPDALVVVPLSSHGELVGVLAIDALFPQKANISPDDRELLDLVGAHAASALLAARAFQAARRKVDTFEGLLGLLRKGTSA
jgi:nitrate/nitrite-specific signal transduction histidine kinase